MSRHFRPRFRLEFDAGDDLWQLVFSPQSPPSFRGGVDQFERHPSPAVLASPEEFGGWSTAPGFQSLFR